MARERWYVGKRHDGKREPFKSASKPTEGSHGHVYKFVDGPFETKGGAIVFAQAWNAGGQTTQDAAERHSRAVRRGIASRW